MSHYDPTYEVPPGYREARRRLQGMRNHALRYPDGMDPDHPGYTVEEVEEAIEELENQI